MSILFQPQGFSTPHVQRTEPLAPIRRRRMRSPGGPRDFVRARTAEEREIRRRTILAAAADLFDKEGLGGTGLNAIAAKARFTKSNIYRYFESREEVLLCLYLEGFEQLLPQVEIAFALCPDGNTSALAGAAARTFFTNPRFPHLLAIVSTVLEHNVSEKIIIETKRQSNVQFMRIAFALHDKMPGTTLEDCTWVANMMGTLIAGMWPAANPSAAAARVSSLAEFAHLRPVLQRDFERGCLALLRGIDGRWLPA